MTISYYLNKTTIGFIMFSLLNRILHCKELKYKSKKKMRNFFSGGGFTILNGFLTLLCVCIRTFHQNWDSYIFHVSNQYREVKLLPSICWNTEFCIRWSLSKDCECAEFYLSLSLIRRSICKTQQCVWIWRHL